MPTHHFKHVVLGLLMAQGLVHLDAQAQSKQIPIETRSNALVLEYDSTKTLKMLYYGEKLNDAKEYNALTSGYKQLTDYSGLSNAAYTASGSKNLLEPAISIVHGDGNRSLDLRYEKHELKNLDGNVKQLDVTLKDPVYAITVVLHYKSFSNEDIIEQWATIQNKEKKEVTVEKFASANLTLRSDSYWLRQYHGDWAKEMQVEETPLTHGIKVLDSKLGTRANLFQPPSFMVSLGKAASEDDGTVLMASLGYSGNFKIDFEVDYLNNLRIIAGINNYASQVKLASNQEFTTPKLIYTLSTKGKGIASRNLHNWARRYQLLDGNGDRLTLLNNWEATYFDFNEQKLKGLLQDTKKLGVDLFLLDDGWFGNKYPRNSDHSSLGDWEPNRKKLPNGIATLVEEATTQGVKFGIWVEPEMVSPKSELYEQHPDWVVKQPLRAEHYFRNQLILDLTNPKVQDFVFNILDELFTKNPALAYIKWDCNAVIYNAHSAFLKDQGAFYISYVEGLYKVLERIRSKYPKVPMMLCSGGGGRVDYAALRYFTEFWPSDNTDPLERIFMQYEYSYFFPAISTANHVTDWGKQSLKFRTDVAMMGKLGFDIVVSHLKEQDLLFCQQAVKNYDAIKGTIWHGDQYRLADPRAGDFAAVSYVNDQKTEAIVFNYLVNNRYGAGTTDPMRLKGLDAQKKYQVEEINIYPGSKSSLNQGQVYSGDYLMKVGVNPDLNSNRPSVILKITAL